MEEEIAYTCPHCWETVTMLLDLSAGGQHYVQDCGVCCNPLYVRYEVRGGRLESFEVTDIEQ